MTHGFVRWTLRTIDLGAARAFYDGLLEEGAPDVVELPAQARARGARPHWLGALAAADPAATTEAFVARGAVRLGGGELLRDPSGAVLAVSPPAAPARRDVAWQQLLTAEPERAQRDYAELFGLRAGAAVELAGYGRLQQFSWDGGPPVGAIGSIAGKPHIHPQWLCFFRVAALDAALARVRERGGLVVETTELPDGGRVAVCDDPQGAAFALRQDP